MQAPAIRRPPIHPLPRRIRALSCCVGALLACSTNPAAFGQPGPSDSRTYTLRVETNLIQIPVLVLTTAKERIRAPIAAGRFSISLNGATPFRPKYAHLEGDDPIDLAIVIDARSPQADLLPKIDEAIAGLAPTYLHPHDTVSIYAIDCSLVYPVEGVPANPAQLKTATDAALRGWMERKQDGKQSACKGPTPLWDVLAYVTSKLSVHPGRRVLLAVTNGDDTASRRTAAAVADFAAVDGVAIFGLTHAPGPSVPMLRRFDPVQAVFSRACEKSGGMLLTLAGSSLSSKMQQLMTMLRERYILEFPRPSYATSGKFIMSIRVDKMDAFIRATGNGIPVEESDTATSVQPTPSSAEEEPSSSSAAPEPDEPDPASPGLDPDLQPRGPQPGHGR